MNISLASIKLIIVRILRRFHAIIFVLVVLGGLIYIVFNLNDILSSSTQAVAPAGNTLNATFDQKTIDRIEKLRTSTDKASELDLSTGRTNPFVE
ncbi:MAG: hypothetical protein ABIQ04_03600 [Candidatus Saccharimonadales bacterium]